MSAAAISELYRELALGRAREAVAALSGADGPRLMAQSAAALEDAAGALACVTAHYTLPGGELAGRWEQEISELVAIAASLEQAADTATHRGP